MTFSYNELQQYKSHFALDLIGHEGQKKLKNAKVLCIGAGGLGSPSLLYLAAAGVGTLGIIDNDQVDQSNLQRQILFTTQDIGASKALIARKRLAALNPYIHLEVYEDRLTPENAKGIFSQYDIIVDGSDNFETRYLVNHTCLDLRKINVSASVSEFKGQCTVFVPFQSPCYNCLFPAHQGEEVLLNCRERGILGILPGILGTIQATEVIKWIVGVGTHLVGKLLQIDVLTLDYKIYTFDKNPDCLLCNNPQGLPTFSYRQQTVCQNQEELFITAQELKDYITKRSAVLIDVRDPDEHMRYNLGGVNIPLSQLLRGFNHAKGDDLIVTYCQLGKRSLKAAYILKKLGFSKVKSLQGGIQGWLGEKR